MAIEIIYTIVDSSGTRGTTGVKVENDITIAGLQGFSNSWATALNNLTLGKIVSAIAHLIVDISGLTLNTIIANSDIEHIGKFRFLTAEGERVDCNIPALGEFVVETEINDEMDVSNPDVAAFLDAMTEGLVVTAATIQPCDVGEQDIVSVVFAREGARNSGARR